MDSFKKLVDTVKAWAERGKSLVDKGVILYVKARGGSVKSEVGILELREAK